MEVVVPVPNIVVPIPQGCGLPVNFWYRYHTNWYRYQHAISTGLEQNFNLGARARSYFNHHFETLMKIEFKPT